MFLWVYNVLCRDELAVFGDPKLSIQGSLDRYIIYIPSWTISPISIDPAKMGKVTPTYYSTRGRAGEIAIWVGADPLGLPASFRGCIWLGSEEKFKAGDDVLVFYRMTKRCRPERKYLAPQWHGPWSMGWKRKSTSNENNENTVQFWGISRFQRETDEDQSAIQLALTVFFFSFQLVDSYNFPWIDIILPNKSVKRLDNLSRLNLGLVNSNS